MNRIYITAFILLTAACGGKELKTQEEKKVVENVISFTDEQMKSVSIKTEKPQFRNFSGFVEVNGMLDVPPQNVVSVMALFGGYVKRTEMLQGKKVRKGEVLCELQDPMYIQLQQEFLETNSRLEYLKAEYERQQHLAEEQVNSQKTYQLAKADYESTLAKQKGLKAKLEMLNISMAALEKGSIQQTIKIVSPINGYVTLMNINIGSYVQPQDLMFRIVDTEHLHAELTVYEKDLAEIAIGQRVMLTFNSGNKSKMAHVYLINKEISPERTVRVHCHLDEEDASLVPGTFLHARIATHDQKLSSLPSAAVVNYENRHFVFASTSGAQAFSVIEVKPIASESGFTAIAQLDTTHMYVTNGAYDLLSKWKNTDEEE